MFGVRFSRKTSDMIKKNCGYKISTFYSKLSYWLIWSSVNSIRLLALWNRVLLLVANLAYRSRLHPTNWTASNGPAAHGRCIHSVRHIKKSIAHDASGEKPVDADWLVWRVSASLCRPHWRLVPMFLKIVSNGCCFRDSRIIVFMWMVFFTIHEVNSTIQWTRASSASNSPENINWFCIKMFVSLKGDGFYDQSYNGSVSDPFEYIHNHNTWYKNSITTTTLGVTIRFKNTKIYAPYWGAPGKLLRSLFTLCRSYIRMKLGTGRT